ncbi:MAG: PilZ domain-containing protein [Acidobacteria bacterium]|nr:PilZ domain-containing protein [Acidobacteriota bacterium]
MALLEHERRVQPRIKPEKEILVEYPEFRPRVRNISISGAFIEDPRPLPRGRVLQVRLLLDGEQTIQAKAMVRRSEPDVGMGVEFIEMTPDDRNRLRKFVGVTAKIERLQSF